MQALTRQQRSEYTEAFQTMNVFGNNNIFSYSQILLHTATLVLTKTAANLFYRKDVLVFLLLTNLHCCNCLGVLDHESVSLNTAFLVLT